MEAVSWLDRYARMRRRLAEAIIQACERLPTKHVAQLFGLHWDSVRLLERRALQTGNGDHEFDPVGANQRA